MKAARRSVVLPYRRDMPGAMEVVTFWAGHRCRGERARVSYERLGFTPAEAVSSGPEGGHRQVYARPSPNEAAPAPAT